MGDFDIGGIFLNFLPPFYLGKYTYIRMEEVGRDINKIEEDLQQSTSGSLLPHFLVTKFKAWTWLFMGGKPSPFLAIYFNYHTEAFVVRNHLDEDSPLQ